MNVDKANNLAKFALALLVGAFVCICGFIAVAFAAARYASLNPVEDTRVYVWVNGIDRCPTSLDYGDLVVSAPHLYRDIQFLEIAAEVPHGEKVELIQEFPNSGKVYVDWGVAGYMDAIFVTNYDPASGVQPDDGVCLP